MVNMSSESAYQLRRQPGADGFRRAWEAALDYGVARMKDIAFERAIEGYLVPCFVGGRLIGWRRKYNDRLLMFCLRHYGEDPNGKRTTINYFSTRASAGTQSSSPRAAGGGGPAQLVEGSAAAAETTSIAAHPGDGREAQSGALAETSATVVRTIISGKGEAPNLDQSTTLIDTFDAVPLDSQAQAEIAAVLKHCAARRRSLEGTAHDPDEHFIAVEQEPKEMLIHDPGYDHPRKELRRPPPAGPGPLVEAQEFLEQSPRLLVQPGDQHRSSDAEFDWQMLDDEEGMKAIEDAVASVKAAKLPSPKCGRGKNEGKSSSRT